MEARKAQWLAVRVTEAEAEKVKALASRTRRSKSDVVRLLLEQAEIADGPDIRLVSGDDSHREEQNDAR